METAVAKELNPMEQVALEYAEEVLYHTSITDVYGNQLNSSIINELAKGDLEVTIMTGSGSVLGGSSEKDCNIRLKRPQFSTKTESATIFTNKFELSIGMKFDEAREAFIATRVTYGYSLGALGLLEADEKLPICQTIQPTDELITHKFYCSTPFVATNQNYEILNTSTLI